MNFNATNILTEDPDQIAGSKTRKTNSLFYCRTRVKFSESRYDSEYQGLNSHCGCINIFYIYTFRLQHFTLGTFSII